MSFILMFLTSLELYFEFWPNVGLHLNSLTPKSVPVKKTRSEGFWLAKHKDTNIPTMMELFSSPAAWF